MDNNKLNKANDLLIGLSRTDKNISPITINDFELFENYFKKERHTYGNSWTYITQGMYGVGTKNLGYKYYDGVNLSAICIYPKIKDSDVNVFYWIRPMGRDIINVINELSKDILKELKLPISVTKIFKDQFDELLTQGFKEVSFLPWDSTSVAEDDTYPEVITDVRKTLSNPYRRRGIKNAKRIYKVLNKKLTIKSIETETDRQKAWEVADKFFRQGVSSLSHNVSTKYDYYNIIFQPSPDPDYHVYMVMNDEVCVGVFDILIMDEKYGCTYASLMLRELVPNLDDFVTIYICNLLNEKGIKYMNVGGSETKGLDDFKKKLETYSTNQMYWAVLI